MEILKNKKAVIFDLDGTIVDSLDVWNRVDVLLAQALGCKSPDAQVLHRLREQALERFKSDPQPYVRFCGEFGKFFGSKLSAEEVHALRYQISRKVLKSDVRLREGADVVIKKFASLGMKLAIATTTRRANIDIYSDVNEAIRQKIHLREYFDVVITMEDVSQIKPDPECYVKALESMCMRLGLTDDTGESCGEVPECWVLVGADRGLCGAYNSELFSYFDREYEKCAVRPLVAVSGKMARAHCAAKGIETAAVFSFSALPTYQEAAKAADVLSGLCDSGRVGCVRLVRQRPVNMMLQVPETVMLCTCARTVPPAETEGGYYCMPDAGAIAGALSAARVRCGMYALMLECSEGAAAATVMAMRQASDNASKTAEALKLKINRLRQSRVTAEVLETSSAGDGEGW